MSNVVSIYTQDKMPTPRALCTPRGWRYLQEAVAVHDTLLPHKWRERLDPQAAAFIWNRPTDALLEIVASPQFLTITPHEGLELEFRLLAFPPKDGVQFLAWVEAAHESRYQRYFYNPQAAG